MSRAGIHALATIADKDERLILGLMSGTSLDGLDLALCRVRGSGIETEIALDSFQTIPYTKHFKNQVRAVFAKRTIDLQALTLLNTLIAETHARLIQDALKDWGIPHQKLDLIASHGQTIYHAPASLHGLTEQPNATLQLGDGDHIARRTGIVTCSDFRQKHVAAGGEGAPLAAYGDILLFSNDNKDRVLLNIGGISNLTFIPHAASNAKAFSSDIGPGNTIMDALAQRDFSKAYDDGATIARQGAVDTALLRAMLKEPFFQAPFPKTTGPELFSLAWAEGFSDSEQCPTPHDMMATLNKLTADAIIAAIQALPSTDPDVFISGGGVHNPMLRERLDQSLPGLSIQSTDALGIDPDAKEAILFALLANELVAGDAQTFQGRLEGGPAVTMGKISLPD